MAQCGYTAPVIISQTGPSGATYAADDYIGIKWRASENGGADVYEYEYAIVGASSTSAHFTKSASPVASRPTAAISASTTALAAGETATITFTFNQSVTVANASAVTASGGSLGTITGSGTSYTATFTPTANSTTGATIKIGNGAFESGTAVTNQDASDTNNSVSIAVDTVAPTVSIAAFTGAANGNQTAVITLSEASTDFVLADLTLTNATATLSGSGSSYTAVLTPSADGQVKLSVGAGKFNDAAGNDNTASNEVTSTVDVTAPTVSIAAFTGAANGNQTAVITLSEASTDFVLADLNLTNATATLSGSGTSYTAVLTPSADGEVKLSVGAGKFNDAAGNDNTASNEVTSTVDVTAPTVSIAAFTGAANGTQTAVITLSEASTDFVSADLTLTNATATLSGSGTSYTAVLTPSADGEVKLSVGAGKFSDAAGNANTASNEVSSTADLTAPTVSIAAFTGAANGTQTAVITLSEASTDFVLADLTLTNATATLSGSGTSYTAVLTPSSDGEVKLSVGAGKFSDAAGNANTASNEVSSTADLTAPTVSIAAFTGAANGTQTAVITLSEASTDFVLADLTLTNATATLSGSGTSYTAVLTPSSDGEVKLSVGAGKFSDAAGNANTASNEVSSTADLTAPTVSIAAFTGAANGTQTAVIILSETSTDFVLADLSLTNATATLSGSGTSYTAVLTPVADGAVKLSVAAATFTDAAGNANTASNEVTTTYDGTAPTVSISTSATAVSGATTLNVVVKFSEDVTGFEASDVVVANGSVNSVTGSGADYVARITATGSGDTTVSVPAGAATDLAGNSSQASNTVTIQNSVVEKTQKIIAQVLQSRASQLISSQPNLSGFLSGSGSGGFNMVVTQAGGNFHFVSAPGTESGLWVRVNGTWTNEETRETKYVFGALGHHFAVSPNILIGGMVEFDFISQQDGAETVEGQGWLAGVYVVTRVPNHPLFIDGRLLYGQTINDVSPIGTYTDTFETERWLAQVNVSGELQFHATTLIPSVQLAYTTDDQAAYTDGLGNMIPSQGIEIWQAAIGLDIRHDVALQNSKASLELTGGIAAIGASTRGAGNSSGVTPSYEGIRARLNMGANYTMENGARLTLETFYDGIGVSSYESYGVQVGFNLAF
ncbi:Ig-like domain-containing protein [Sulfitobacter sp. CW3]|uniref:Ig-like domain-containing protein n=1 Tax=Sulfitobacter sp. CW3 TaxID=2861965 RepID=UPI001C5CFAC5|nr:Ig-like domain-containing protein [Sulfitobacter sp. CW3]MBW4960643.1 hypothetical protein [Sulfitobacter sp. CW3]